MDAKPLEAKTLEIHYYLDDGTHAIDAKAFYACQQELIGLIDYVTKQLSVEVDIKTIVRKEEGGVIEYLSILTEHFNIVKLGVAYLAGVLGPGLKEGAKQIITHYVTQILKSKEKKKIESLKLQKKKLKQEKEIAELEEDTKNKQFSPENEVAVQKRRSKFYSLAKSVAPLSAIKFGVKEEARSTEYLWSVSVSRGEFDKYITASTEIEPIEDDDALIEVVAPVLTKEKRKNKWRGVYGSNGSIPFSVSDRAFLKKVWSRQIVFSNGSTLHCVLDISREVSTDGIIKHSYDVVEVFDVLDDGMTKPLPPRKKKTPPPSEEPDLFSGQYDLA